MAGLLLPFVIFVILILILNPARCEIKIKITSKIMMET